MDKIMVVRYETRADAAEENQQVVEKVFAQLNADDRGGLRYATFRLADGVTFVHIAITEGDADTLAQTSAFADFQQGIGNRLAGSPVRQEATLVGSYRFVTP